MKRLLTVAALFSAGSLIAMQGAAADDAAMIKSAESAAPAAVASGATIYAMEKGGMRTLREGTNGYWCMPDKPASPGPDPMCGDANAMEWVMSKIGKVDPPEGKVGFLFMLAGGSESNTDPYATEPTPDNNWVTTGPHVMILNAGDMMQGYPTDDSPDISKPYVMWSGTPHAHLMIPVE